MRDNCQANIEPLVSVACATYNHKRYIRKAIDSFLTQKCCFQYEIIIHDDASTDGTSEIVREYAELHPDIIKPLYQTQNQYSRGRKCITEFVLPKCQGKYIAFCEGDDYWTDPLKLQRQVEIFQKYPDCIICGGRARTWSEANESFTLMTPSLDKDIKCMSGTQFFYLDDWVKTCTRMVPRDYFLQIPLRFAMDYCNVHYLLATHPSRTFRCIEEEVAVYREHSKGVFSGLDQIGRDMMNCSARQLIMRLFKDERRSIMANRAAGDAMRLCKEPRLPLITRMQYGMIYMGLRLSCASRNAIGKTFKHL
jgi:glycosyltransferase involved in cell wall biosynthesis